MLPERLRWQRLGQSSYASKGSLFLDDPVVFDLLMGEEPEGNTYAGHQPEIVGTEFAYEPGRLETRFSQREYDYIYLDVRLTGHAVIQTHIDGTRETATPVRHQKKDVDLAIHTTSQQCPMKDFITFLEAIAIDVEECAFYWDAEFCYGRMGWERRFPRDTGLFTVEWSTSKEQFSHRIMLNTRETVSELYSAFRRLVESQEYDRLRYERLTYGEAFALLLSDATLGDLMDEFVRRDAIKAKEVFQKLGDIYDSRRTDGQKNERRSIEYFLAETNPNEVWNDCHEYDGWIGPEWDTWGIDQRKYHLETYLSYTDREWQGNNLQKTRSKLIEDWLGSVKPTASPVIPVTP